jgi:hypothetical protein
MEDLIKSALVDLLKKQITKAAVAKMSFLATGLPASLLGFFVNKLAIFLIENTILGAKILSSRIEINKQVKEIEDAVKQSKGENLTDEEKQQILDRIRRASDDLIKF